MYFEDIELVHRNDTGPDMFDYWTSDLITERFGSFTVIRQEFSSHHPAEYRLECQCGHSILKTVDELNEQRLYNCGSCPIPAPRFYGRRHGRQRIMGILRGAIQRCHRPSSRNYRFYGARGIAVCDEWRNDPDSYYRWSIENGYNDDLTLDRIDNYSGYGPTNCRWVTMQENLQNKRCHQDARERLTS